MTLLFVGSVPVCADLQSVHGGDEYMNQYVTGAIIKELRERNKMTQLQLASWQKSLGSAIRLYLNGRQERDIRILPCLSL